MCIRDRINDDAPPNTIRKATPPAQPRGEARPPAQPGGARDNDFSPNDVVSEADIEMEAGVEIRGEEIYCSQKGSRGSLPGWSAHKESNQFQYRGHRLLEE
eukprot:3320819-Pyramimonas_sp.AAC.1